MLGDLGKIIVAKGFKRLPKVQKIARSGHTGCVRHFKIYLNRPCASLSVIPRCSAVEAESSVTRLEVFGDKFSYISGPNVW